jgi:hypothetical protein
LELKCDEPLANFAFNFNLRHYTEVAVDAARRCATLTLTTKVRATADGDGDGDGRSGSRGGGGGGGGGGISMEDCVALGAQAMADSARVLMETRTHAAVAPAVSDRESDRSHHAITRLLATGKIVRYQAMGETEDKFG